MGVSLYRKYRPQNFSSVVGQKAAVDVLTHSITKSRVGHAYLFSGSRGCGKTSVARIFAKALNCLDRQDFEPCGKCKNCLDITAGDSLDVIEIDGASNNGVENIRGLKENVTLAPFSSKYKIYIIDEVHMLSQGAFNALLKTLEEPPEHVIFIMATTEPHKVPVTIRSRCQHIPFHSISPEDIFSRLEEVCRLENITAESEALWEISRQADGALRDALSLLEQITAAGDVTLANVENVLGAGSRSAFEKWVALLRENLGEAYTTLKSMFDAGASSVRIFEEIFALVRNLWLVSKWPGMVESLGVSSQEKKFLQSEAKNWKPEKLHELLQVIMKVLTQARSGVRNDILLGMWLLYMERTPQKEREVLPKFTPQSVPNFAPPPAPVSTPAPEAVYVPAEKVQEDLQLKENLLNIAHEKNFTIYAALFDARTSENNGSLILDMEHAYSYEVLRVDRVAAEISGIFANFEKIILRYRASECICPKFAMEDFSPPPRQMIIDKPARKFDNEIVFVSDKPEPAQEPPRIIHESSIFDKIKRGLAQAGAKPEVILVKHGENPEDTSDDDDESSEEIIMPEEDNE